MIDLRGIVCPIDFSEFSGRALAHAAALARWYEARLALLYVAPLMPVVGGFPPLVSPVTLEPIPRERLLADMREFAGPATVGLAPDFVLREGPAASGIVEYARESAADLVVLGTHGRGGFERLVLGSVAEKVLRKAPCPVLTVSRSADAVVPHEPPEMKHIVCAVDFSRASRDALRHALSLAQRANGRLTTLYVLEWPDGDVPGPFNVAEYRSHLERDALLQLRSAVPQDARDWCEVREVVAVGTPWREILRVAAEEGAELVVMGVHGRSALDRLLFGSTAHHVVRQAACPVLTVRSRDDQ